MTHLFICLFTFIYLQFIVSALPIRVKPSPFVVCMFQTLISGAVVEQLDFLRVNEAEYAPFKPGLPKVGARGPKSALCVFIKAHVETTRFGQKMLLSAFLTLAACNTRTDHSFT